jgi:hypothetical protein
LKTGKHVIFLGAGASRGSGYPLANGLRLLISSRKKWEEALVGYENKQGLGNRPITTLGMAYWDRHKDALDLFRKGGFATIDEFCKLAGISQLQNEIHGLRCMLRAALGLFNPEESFEKSEYYGFVQSVFADNLVSLRDDITILTYNYDPYLEFLLFRAKQHRWSITRRGKGFIQTPEDMAEQKDLEIQLNSVTSGFYSQQDFNWLSEDRSKKAFCVLKLHGAICHFADEAAGFESLFSDTPIQRAEKLFKKSTDGILPPILFPWEIVTEKSFADAQSFPLHRNLKPLFSGIWQRARREIQSANKISFVGMSMHSFLLDGLKFLFNGKAGQVEVCVANSDTPAWVRANRETYWQNKPHTSAYTVNKMLKEFAPDMNQVGVTADHGLASDQITLVSDFESFVKTQMKPIAIN